MRDWCFLQPVAVVPVCDITINLCTQTDPHGLCRPPIFTQVPPPNDILLTPAHFSLTTQVPPAQTDLMDSCRLNSPGFHCNNISMDSRPPPNSPRVPTHNKRHLLTLWAACLSPDFTLRVLHQQIPTDPACLSCFTSRVSFVINIPLISCSASLPHPGLTPTHPHGTQPGLYSPQGLHCTEYTLHGFPPPLSPKPSNTQGSTAQTYLPSWTLPASKLSWTQVSLQ
ncbi:hypothetical protein DPEC_G00215920 [Dallia pectoralis]|uniref:Uncharacterized protein n=1 Tax=Dallia pectoralis TaxID=75939 RepID=A0ACC2G2V3_DALPE|nr:hypothetical protein DPEC_G00215920 [Dallia pectoralis]